MPDLLDEKPSVNSPVAELVRRYPIHSTHVIAHIRKATQGEVALENCHPFRRELWGRYWVFAHNGDLPDFYPDNTGLYQPVGKTDSERAFCLILEKLRQQFPLGKPSLKELYSVLKEITEDVAKRGIFNYLISDGEHFFAHCSTNLCYIVRQAPFAAAHLIDQDITVDFSELTTPKRSRCRHRHYTPNRQRNLDAHLTRGTTSISRRLTVRGVEE